MCNPLMAVGTAGLFMSAYGAMKSQQASNDAADYQASVADRNAQIANMQAQAAIAEGQNDKKNLQERLRAVQGAQRTGYAGGGVMVDDGSAFDALSDTAVKGELEALQIENNAQRQAWSYGVSADSSNAQANMYRSSKSSAFGAGFTSLLSGAGKLGTSYLMSIA